MAVLCAPDSWYLADLQRAANGRHEVIGVSFSDVAAICGEGRPRITAAGLALTDLDAVLVRTMPPGSLEQVVFRMDALARLRALDVFVVNPPRSIEAAVDKYLATALLASAALPTPRTIVCQTAADALAAFDELGRDVVVKPLFGGEGRGIFRVADPDLAHRAFHTLQQLRAVAYVQEFIPHAGYDVRLFVLGDQVFGMRRVNPLDWRTNVSRGAHTEPFPVDAQWIDLALAATRAVGASIAGVDVLPGSDGRLRVIEVNAVPGWKALARTLDLDIAAMVLDFLQSGASA